MDASFKLTSCCSFTIPGIRSSLNTLFFTTGWYEEGDFPPTICLVIQDYVTRRSPDVCSDSGKCHVWWDQLHLSLAVVQQESGELGEIPYPDNIVLNSLLVSMSSGRSRRYPMARCALLRKPGSSLHEAYGWHSSESHC